MADEGASPRELVLEACRRNNTSLLEDVLLDYKSAQEIAPLLNNARDGIGNGVLHVAASYGSCTLTMSKRGRRRVRLTYKDVDDVIDLLLDQEGLEVDSLDRLERDTPLHKAVRYVNEQPKTEWSDARALVDLLLDAGCDPRYHLFLPSCSTALAHARRWVMWDLVADIRENRIRNKAKLRPFDLVDPRNTDLRQTLQKAEFAYMAGDDVVEENGDEHESATGSASDSE